MVGDSTRPLYFLILTSILNIILDLFFVLVLQQGIAGVAYATIIAQFISAGLTLLLLSRSKDVFRLTWRDMKIEWETLRQIFAVGLPTGIQSVITAFSNVFVQSYINAFGSECMAGWSSYNKLNQFCMLPTQSLSVAVTTFVSQNIGAGREKRADRGTAVTVGLSVCVLSLIAALLYIFAEPAVRLFTKDAAVISFGVLFIHTNTWLQPFGDLCHVFAGALRGRGDSRGPMIIMLSTFVGLRQLYLFLITRFVVNTPVSVGIGYPVGWLTCCATMAIYYRFRVKRKVASITV